MTSYDMFGMYKNVPAPPLIQVNSDHIDRPGFPPHLLLPIFYRVISGVADTMSCSLYTLTNFCIRVL